MSRASTGRLPTVTRRYKVRRIGMGSVVRAAMLFGVLVWLCPALLGASAAVTALRSLSTAAGRLEQLNIALPVISLLNFSYDIPDVPVNVVEQLDLGAERERVDGLVAQEGLVFVAVAALLLLLGSLGLALPALAFAGLYNLLARGSGGLELELEEAIRRE